MAIESAKKAMDREESGQNMKAKYNLGPPSIVIVTNIEPIKLETYWIPRRI